MNPLHNISIRLLSSLVIHPRLRKVMRDNLMRKNSFGNSLSATIKAYQNFKKYKNHTDFRYHLSVLACLKNEAAYVCEWIEYYKLMGAEHFYLYNNDSTDNIKEILAPYIEDGTVTLTDHHGEAQQYTMYALALEQCRLETKWLAVVDLDEFLLPKQHKTLTEFVNSHEDYDQLVFDWYVFGDSGHKTKPDGLVIENFLYRDSKAWPHSSTKAIIRPCRTYNIRVHTSNVEKTKKFPLDEGQCNHYYGKSEEEFFAKKAKRKSGIAGLPKYTRDAFDEHNKNDVYDNSMLQYVDKIKAALAAKNRL